MANIYTRMTDGAGLGIKKKPVTPTYKNPYTPAQPLTSKKASTYDPNFGDAGLYNQSFKPNPNTVKPEASTQIIQQQPIVAQQPDTTIQEMMEALCVKPSKAQLRAMERFYNNR